MFSNQGLVLQLSYVLLIAALFARTPQRMRQLIAASAIVMLLRATLLVRDPATISWMGLLLAIWLVMLWGDRTHEGKIRFTDDEEAMRIGFLSALPRSAARQFIDQGLWLSGTAGEVLTQEGEPVGNLYYLLSGDAEATSQGRQVGTCRAGDLIGEATILSGDAATATVTLNGPATFWCASTTALRRFLDDHDGLRIAIERSLASAVKDKLRAANRTIAGGT
ncbi:MAG: cyclic nucleotide-binding domain-containing protein [Sphingomonas bacterium]